MHVDLIFAQAAAAGLAGSVPNPFMSDFPNSGPSSMNASNLGLFDADNDNITTSDGNTGDLFSAGGQADFFGGDGTAVNTSDGGNAGDAVLGCNIQQGAASSVTLASGKSTATPPPRPPPPSASVNASNGTPRAMSPSICAASGRPSGAAPSKSAFDDLNDSIRMALGGSPSRPPPIAQQTNNLQHTQQTNAQQGFGMFDMGGSLGGVGQNITGVNNTNQTGFGINSQNQIPLGYGSPAKQPMSGDESLQNSMHAVSV